MSTEHLARTGDIWHGFRSCGNVLRIVSVDDELQMMLVCIEELANPHPHSLDLHQGALVVRPTLHVHSWQHLAQDCPDA